jgi:hypothetical protein
MYREPSLTAMVSAFAILPIAALVPCTLLVETAHDAAPLGAVGQPRRLTA